jgi:hypothetical protein
MHKHIKLIFVVVIMLLLNINVSAQEVDDEFFNLDDFTDISLNVLLKYSVANNNEVWIETDNEPHPFEYYLEVSLINNMDKTININRSLLPWGNSIFNNMRVQVIRLSDNKMLKKVRGLGCLSIDEVNFPPRDMKQGNIFLSHDVPELVESLKSSDILIKWEYRLKPLGETDYSPSKLFKGELIIPKQ